MPERIESRPGGDRTRRPWWRRDSGAEAVEFALVLPLLLTLLFGIISVGATFYHYETMIGDTDAAARYMAAARGVSYSPAPTCGSGPYACTVNIAQNYATGLAAGSLTVTVTVNGTTCTDASTPSCTTLLAGAQGQQVAVQTTYPCAITVMGKVYAPNCTLTQKLTQIIE